MASTADAYHRAVKSVIIKKQTNHRISAIIQVNLSQWRIQGVETPALLFRCPFLKRTYFENMSLRFLAEQGAS